MGVAGARLDAELVAFGVVHDGDVVEAFGHGGAQAAEAGDFLVHGGEGPQVEVEAVGGGLGAAGAAEPDVGAAPGGGFDVGAFGGGVLVDVGAEGGRPEAGHGEGVGAVEGEVLDEGGHAASSAGSAPRGPGWAWAGLAGGAPVGDAVGVVAGLVGLADGGAAAAAGLAGAAGDPVGAAGAGVAGGDLAAGGAVGLHQALEEVDHAGQVLDLADRGPGVDAAQETGLGLVDVARAGDGPLVEQGGADGPAGVGAEAAQGLGRVPVGAEDVGAEVADDLVLAGGGQQLADAESEPDRDPGLGAEHGPDLEVGAAPALPRAVQVPGPLHLEVGVQGGPGVGAQQQVLAAGGDLADGLAAEVGGGEAGHAEVGGDQALAGQGGVMRVAARNTVSPSGTGAA